MKLFWVAAIGAAVTNLAGCVLFPSPEQVACHNAYPDGGGAEVIDSEEEWRACFPDGGSVKCRSRYHVDARNDYYPDVATGEGSTDVPLPECPKN